MLSMSYKIRYDMTKRNEAIAILTGGGPAPGMNTVVGSVAKTFLQKGYSVIGLHKGFTGLFREAPATENITFLKADEIFNLAGSFLRMSRFKPSDEDFEKRFNWQFFTENNIKLLVTIGGTSTNNIDVWDFADEGEEDQKNKGLEEATSNVYGNGHTSLYADVIEAIEQDRAPYVDAYAGKNALELVLAIYKSQKEGRAVKLPLENFASIDMKGEF